jgi:UDP-GlcNAc:undecaprenyl-phosphate/decaprenyl-phosphate GlcNAc-1-phosphate transferase
MLSRALGERIAEWQWAPAMAPLLGFALALAAGWLLSVAVARVCRHYGLLDVPRGRRLHAIPAPRLGGVAIFVAFGLAAALLYRPSSPYEAHVVTGLFAAAGLTVAVMAVDDARGLPAGFRLLAQTAAALLVMFPAAHGMIIEVIHNPFGQGADAIIPLPLWVAVPFTWFWIVGMMNTINWVDGVDGLAGGVVAIAAAVMAAVSWMLGQTSVAALCAMLAGASLGFLLLNWRPGKLFMGDSGAMFLGLALATLAGIGGAKLATMLLLLGVPILDAARVIVRRVGRGESPARADRSHLHHRLLASGFSQRQVALLFYGVTAAFGGVTILAAYLQAHTWQWSAVLHITPWLRLAVTEAPTALGLVLIPALTVAIWVALARRRARHAAMTTQPLPRKPEPRGDLATSSSGTRPRPY